MNNSLDGRMQPLLAQSSAVHDDAVEITLNDKARWNDGKPVSGWDVRFTFVLCKRYESLTLRRSGSTWSPFGPMTSTVGKRRRRPIASERVPRRHYRPVQAVFQDPFPAFNQFLTIASQLKSGFELFEQRPNAEEIEARVDSALRAVDILEYLMKLKREPCMTIVFIPHDIGLAGHISDSIFIMHRGRLVEQGTPEQVTSRPESAVTAQLLEAFPDVHHE